MSVIIEENMSGAREGSIAGLSFARRATDPEPVYGRRFATLAGGGRRQLDDEEEDSAPPSSKARGYEDLGNLERQTLASDNPQRFKKLRDDWEARGKPKAAKALDVESQTGTTRPSSYFTKFEIPNDWEGKATPMKLAAISPEKRGACYASLSNVERADLHERNPRAFAELRQGWIDAGRPRATRR